MMKNISTQRLQGLSIGMISSAEFQVIIAIDFDDGRLFPLTENLPQCLLPIGNEKILRLQLNSLEKCGATGIH